MSLDETPRGRQPEPGSPGLGREEGHKNLLVQLGGDPGPTNRNLGLEILGAMPVGHQGAELELGGSARTSVDVRHSTR